jgi:AcrR family transcriptional regulator
MGRWDPDARGRLERAALELFAEQGYTDTTVPQITERAGLTTRTFFRYFTDKREVLFSGEEEIRTRFTEIIRTAPTGLSPIQLIRYGLEQSATTIFQPRFEHLRDWRAIIGSEDALRERALRKQELTTEAAVTALRERGFDEQTADMIARLSNLLLQTAVGRWVAQPVEERPLVTFVDEALDQLCSTVGSTWAARS